MIYLPNKDSKLHYDLIISVCLLLAIAALLSYGYATSSEIGKHVAIYIGITMGIYYAFRHRFSKMKLDRPILYKAMMFAVIGVVLVDNAHIA